MKIDWPDLKLPPINLWSAPRIAVFCAPHK